jgi:hypothetical protein
MVRGRVRPGSDLGLDAHARNVQWDGSCGDQVGDHRVGDEDVVDELVSALVDAGVVVGWGHRVAGVPEPLWVSVVGVAEASGPVLGARGAEDELGGGGVGGVVEVAAHEQRLVGPGAGEGGGGPVAERAASAARQSSA